MVQAGGGPQTGLLDLREMELLKIMLQVLGVEGGWYIGSILN